MNTRHRATTLTAALRLWDDVVEGRDARHWGEANRVGGRLTGPDGMLLRAPQLRDRLRGWLRPGPRSNGSPADFENFLVSWMLSATQARTAAGSADESRRRIDADPYVLRAVGWGDDQELDLDTTRYAYLSVTDMRPEGLAGGLVDAAVDELINAGAEWWEAKRSTLVSTWRMRLSPAIADRLGLFDRPAGTPTAKIVRLAFTMAVGAVLRGYVDRCTDPFSEDDEPLRRAADTVVPLWTNPTGRRELQELSAAREVPGDTDADLQAIFRTQVERAEYFREPAPASLDSPEPGDGSAWRELSILLELAIADVLEYRGDAAVRLDDLIADVLLEVLEPHVMRHENIEMMAALNRLRERGPGRTGRPAARTDDFALVSSLLERLHDAPARTPRHPARAQHSAGDDEVLRLVDVATRYLEHQDRYGPERVLKEFADSLAPVVTALAPGNDVGSPFGTPADARWRLFEASGAALAQLPDDSASILVAGSFAELGWAVANERAPADMRAVNDPVLRQLRALRPGPDTEDMAGPLTRVMRVRPLADSKKANFPTARRAAHESVVYGTRKLAEAMDAPKPDVHRFVAALTGLQLSVLQAGGVYVRSAETELILRINYSTRDRQNEHPRYISALASSAYTYTNLAIARLHDLREVVKARIAREDEINFPVTASASTAAMGMRTLLLWATMHLAYPARTRLGEKPVEVKTLIPSVPGQFRAMLALPDLSPLNFGDMTRIALHYAFLSDDLRHPATGAKKFHRNTPAHLRPGGSGRLDIEACGEYLRARKYDAGILDVIELEGVRELLNERSNGRYGDWRERYHNDVKRRPTRYTPGDLEHSSATLRDPIVGR